MRGNIKVLALLGLLTFVNPAQLAAQQSTTNAKQAAAPAPAATPRTTVLEATEQAEQERLNRDMAEFAARQLAANEASRAAHEQAERERQETIARQNAEHQAALAATEAERLRGVQDYEAAMARWRADVEACRTGDFSRCGK